MAEDIRLVAYVHAKPGQEDFLRDAMLAGVAPTRAEPGCLMYVLHRDASNPAMFVFVEHWKSQAALDEHMQTPHFKAVAAVVMHVLRPV